MIKTSFLVGVAALGYLFLGKPACAQLLYANDFNQNGATGTVTALSEAGWTGSTNGEGLSRLYQLSGANWAVWSYNYVPEAFYTAPGVLAPISIANTSDLIFSVNLEASYNNSIVDTYIAVETSNDQWYVSATPLTKPASSSSFTTETLNFSATAADWHLLNGIVDAGTTGGGVSIGPAAGSDLSGNIIAAGVLTTRSTSDGTVNFDNFSISGDVVSSVPEPSTNALMLAGLAGVAFTLRRRRAMARGAAK